MSLIQGGRFESGFYAGAVGSIVGEFGISRGNRNAQLAIASTLGGTASALGGGKFLNGAVSAAFTLMFNNWMHPSNQPTDEQISRKLSSFAEKLRQFEFQQRLYSKSLHPSLWTEDFSFGGYTLPNIMNTYSEPIIYNNIQISFGDHTINVTFKYSPSDVPERNTASSIKTPGTTSSFSFAQSGLSGLPKVYLNNKYQHTVGVIYFNNLNDYNTFQNYVYPQ